MEEDEGQRNKIFFFLEAKPTFTSEFGGKETQESDFVLKGFQNRDKARILSLI